MTVLCHYLRDPVRRPAFVCSVYLLFIGQVSKDILSSFVLVCTIRIEFFVRYQD